MLSIRKWTRYDWAWLFGIGWMVGTELAAVRNDRPGDTFSELWYWLTGRYGTPPRHVWTIRALLFGFTCWLVAHLWTRRV